MVPTSGLVVQELEQQMNAPDMAITDEYLHTLAKLKHQNEHAPMPPYPAHDAEEQKLWQGRMQTLQKELGELSDALFLKAAALSGSRRWN